MEKIDTRRAKEAIYKQRLEDICKMSFVTRCETMTNKVLRKPVNKMHAWENSLNANFRYQYSSRGLVGHDTFYFFRVFVEALEALSKTLFRWFKFSKKRRYRISQVYSLELQEFEGSFVLMLTLLSRLPIYCFHERLGWEHLPGWYTFL